jgi:hypothetical protein
MEIHIYSHTVSREELMVAYLELLSQSQSGDVSNMTKQRVR